MLACSQHTAHLLQKSNHFGPKQSKSRQADLRWGLTWARLRQQYASSGSITNRISCRPNSCSSPDHGHYRSSPFGHQLQTELCSKIIALPGVCPGYLSIYLPSLQTGEWKTPFLQTLLLLGVYVSLGAGIYVLPPRRKTKHFLGKCNHNVTISISP